MQFFEKLDFLMKLSNTTNSALAMQVNLDPSHISRLRRGKRNPVRDENCLKAMADCFARRCADAYQRKALADMLGPDPLTAEEIPLSQSILKWLIDERNPDTANIETFLKGMSGVAVRRQRSGPGILLPAGSPRAETEIFFGMEGKRRVVEHFLSEVLAQKKPQTLLLYSDEPTDWMTSDRGFAARWTTLMIQVLEKGNRIQIIHTVSRHLDEMLHAITQWMPLYMSGMIEPYYYPKKKDGVFKRTLFVAPDTAAVMSSSTGDMLDRAANFMVRNPSAVSALAEEFHQYLSLCNPLMQVFTPEDKLSYIDRLLEFEREKSDSILVTESLSLLTMPEALASRVFSRLTDPGIPLGELAAKRMEGFQRRLHDNSFTEIIRILDLESIRSGKIKIASSDMLSGLESFYTAEEYLSHLENIRHLLESFENFHVHVTEDPVESRYMAYAKEDLGVIVSKTSAPPVALAINESNLTAGFWDYLRNFIGDAAYRNPNKKNSFDKLDAYIRQVRRLRQE